MAHNDSVSRSKGRFKEVARGEGVALAPWARYILAAVMFGMALAARFAMMSGDGEFTFITFYPAVALSALLFGTGPGLLTLALSAAAADYYFMTPYQSFGLDSGQMLPLAIFTISGGIICFLAHQTRRNGEALRESQKRFLQLFDAAPVGQLLIALEDLRIIRSNDAAAIVYGYRCGEPFSRAFAEYEVAGEGMLSAEIQMRLLAEGQAQFDTQIRRKDGVLRDVSNTAVLSNWDRENVYHVTQIDVTERKAREAALHDAFRESQDLYDNAPTGYHCLSADGTFLRINDTELSWLGYERAEVVDRMKLFDLLTPSCREAFFSNFPKLMATGALHDVRAELVRKDGSVLPVLVNATTVRDAHGQFLMTRTIVVDLTEKFGSKEHPNEAPPIAE